MWQFCADASLECVFNRRVVCRFLRHILGRIYRGGCQEKWEMVRSNLAPIDFMEIACLRLLSDLREDTGLVDSCALE